MGPAVDVVLGPDGTWCIVCHGCDSGLFDGARGLELYSDVHQCGAAGCGYAPAVLGGDATGTAAKQGGLASRVGHRAPDDSARLFGDGSIPPELGQFRRHG